MMALSPFKAPLILASKSSARQTMLRNAGYSFAIESADLDEAQLIKDLAKQNSAPEEIVIHLAQAKARHVSLHHRNAYILGADQLLICQAEIYSKPEHRLAAREQLMKLSGRTHQLYSGAALVLNDAIVTTAISKASITLREMTPREIEDYLDFAGPDILHCVGSYQLEGAGIHLFEHIEGDYWTILGLPLLELNRKMRQLGLSVS